MRGAALRRALRLMSAIFHSKSTASSPQKPTSTTPRKASQSGHTPAELHATIAELRGELANQRMLTNRVLILVEALTNRVAALEAKEQPAVAPSPQRPPTAAANAADAAPARRSQPTTRHETLGGGGEPCARCGKTVYVAERILARGTVLHRDCFRCARCDGRLINSPNWEIHQGTFYCGPHFQQIVNSGAKIDKEPTADELQEIIRKKILAAECELERGLSHLKST